MPDRYCDECQDMMASRRRVIYHQPVLTGVYRTYRTTFQPCGHTNTHTDFEPIARAHVDQITDDTTRF